MINPIVTFLFYFSVAFSIILSKTWLGIGCYSIILVLILIIKSNLIKPVLSQIKPFIMFFPIMIVAYLFISFTFTSSSWIMILNEAGFAIGKLLLLVATMGLYLEISKKQNLILAVRTIWVKMNFKWKRVEDMFMFLELTLRFYPTFQREWQIIRKSKTALGIQAPINSWERLKSITNDLPGMILQSYRKAEKTAIAMQERGYGNMIPRGVANPIQFTISDLIVLVLVMSGFIMLNQYAAL